MSLMRDDDKLAPWDEGFVWTPEALALQEAALAEAKARAEKPVAFRVPTQDDLKEDDNLQKLVSREAVMLWARDTARDIYTSATSKRDPIAVLSQAELLARPAPEWWVEGWVQKGTIAELAGPPGLGKSFLALHLASCMASGTPVWRRPVSKARILYVVAEGASAFGERGRAWQLAHPSAYVPADAIGYVERGVNLSNTESVRELREVFEAGGYDVLILDTYSQLSGVADENSAAENARVLNAIRSIREVKEGASVILVHHTDARGTKARGSTTLTANVDTVLMLKPDSGSGWSISTRLEHGGKQKDGQPEVTHGYALQDVAGSSSAVVRWSGTQPVSPYWEPVRDILADGEWHTAKELREASDIHASSGSDYDRWKADMAKWTRDGLLEAEGATSSRRYRLAPAIANL